MEEAGLIDTTEVVAVPVTIHTDLPQGPFVVRDVASWTWEAHGIFATGNWVEDLDDDLDPGPPERDVLIPYGHIEHLEYDFDALTYAIVDDFIADATADATADDEG